MKSRPPVATPPDPSPRLRLTVTAPVGKPLVPYLREHLRAAHAILNPPLVELSLALVGDPAMSDLHLRFLNVPGPTDVLTFPLDEDDDGSVLAGEVVVCVPEARRRAKAEGTELEREVLLYALHGMLHLCGYDDTSPRQYSRMHRAEDEILTKIGVGPVFRTSSVEAAPATGAKLSKASPATVKRAKAVRPGSSVRPASRSSLGAAKRKA